MIEQASFSCSEWLAMIASQKKIYPTEEGLLLMLAVHFDSGERFSYTKAGKRLGVSTERIRQLVHRLIRQGWLQQTRKMMFMPSLPVIIRSRRELAKVVDYLSLLV